MSFSHWDAPAAPATSLKILQSWLGHQTLDLVACADFGPEYRAWDQCWMAAGRYARMGAALPTFLRWLDRQTFPPEIVVAVRKRAGEIERAKLLAGAFPVRAA